VSEAELPALKTTVPMVYTPIIELDAIMLAVPNTGMRPAPPVAAGWLVALLLGLSLAMRETPECCERRLWRNRPGPRLP
jgi:hypothetical protein